MPSHHPSSHRPIGTSRRKLPTTTWVGIIGTSILALIALASGGVWSMLLMTALVVLITAVYGLLFRRTTWLRLPRKRSAAALGAGLAFVVLLGSGSAFGAAHPSSPAADQPAAIAASPAPTRTPHAAATTNTPTPTPTPTPTVTTKLVTETARIPFESTTVEDDTLAQGTTTVTTEGVRGVQTTTYRVTITDGKETGRQQVRLEVTTPPVAQVTSVGTYVAPAPAPAPAVPDGGGATALCVDGSLSYAAHHQGACSHHGGVAQFYK
ncbi:G5 domain-containing protein [Curtobacterium sp. TC1]|uniref:G5 domain-containing protein n=1 Tax=Curtobacterium sp. TC1 TaxID=2862880 RepID=UPI0021BFFCBD|nr:G5 domain-containing protein [Curtobacterium sp. TC1]